MTGLVWLLETSKLELVPAARRAAVAHQDTAASGCSATAGDGARFQHRSQAPTGIWHIYPSPHLASL